MGGAIGDVAPLGERTRTRLDHRLAVGQRDGRLPSVVAGLVRGGRPVWHGAVGTADGRPDGRPVDVDTQYRMGSITKTFVAVCVMRLRDAGRLDLADRLEQHVPGSALGDVTLAQLLSHGGGVQAETTGPWWERTPGVGWDTLAGGVGRRFEAGRRFHYSNVGFAALGELLARAHGRDWADVVRDELLDPLGMTRTTTRPVEPAARGLAVHPFADVLLPEPEHDAGAMAPAGQLWSTVADLSRWAALLAGDTGDVLAADTLAEMLEPRTVVDLPGLPWTAAWGLGWQLWNVDGARHAGHGGSMPGFLAALRVDLTGGDGLVQLTNTTSAPSTGPLATELLALLAEEEPPPVEPWSARGVPATGTTNGTTTEDEPASALLELTGTWHWGPAVTTARLVGEHLVLGEPGQQRGARFALTASSGHDEWVGLDDYHTGEPLRVVRRPDGTVSHLDLASFRLTRTPYATDADVPGGVDEAGWR